MYSDIVNSSKFVPLLWLHVHIFFDKKQYRNTFLNYHIEIKNHPKIHKIAQVRYSPGGGDRVR